MTDYDLAGLTKCRAEMSGEAATLLIRLAQIGTDVGHLNALIRISEIYVSVRCHSID